jgi:hypothetical protein
MPDVLKMVVCGIGGALVFGGAVFWNDLEHLDNLRKQLADAQGEVGRLKTIVTQRPAPVVQPPVNHRRGPERPAKIADDDPRIVGALEAQHEAQQRLIAALEENKKLLHAEAERATERETLMKAHIAKLPPADRTAFVELTEKATVHKLTWDEFRELERIAGGEFSYLALPKLHEVRKDAIRRVVKDNPSMERSLRALEPDAFANDGKDQ